MGGWGEGGWGMGVGVEVKRGGGVPVGSIERNFFLVTM